MEYWFSHALLVSLPLGSRRIMLHPSCRQWPTTSAGLAKWKSISTVGGRLGEASGQEDLGPAESRARLGDDVLGGSNEGTWFCFVFFAFLRIKGPFRESVFFWSFFLANPRGAFGTSNTPIFFEVLLVVFKENDGLFVQGFASSCMVCSEAFPVLVSWKALVGSCRV